MCAIDDASFAQQWGLDATGNWSDLTQLDAADSAQNLSQQRTTNRANEITSINRRYGPEWAPCVYDRNGNTIEFPQPADPSHEFEALYDAWNRLATVKLSRSQGSTLIAAYTYDARGFRITNTAEGSTRHSYYTAGWQCLEERVDSSTDAERQFLWGLRYIDDLVLRDAGSTRLYEVKDANWNTVAIIDDEGAVQQRFRYTAYGEPTRLNPDGAVATGNDEIDWEYLYCNYRWDRIASIHEVRHRNQESIVGRWLTPDPVGYGLDMSRYTYLTSNPIGATDPLGLFDIGSMLENIVNNMINGITQYLAIPCGSLNVTVALMGSASLAAGGLICRSACVIVDRQVAKLVNRTIPIVISLDTCALIGAQCCNLVQLPINIPVSVTFDVTGTQMAKLSGKPVPANCACAVSISVTVNGTATVGVCS